MSVTVEQSTADIKLANTRTVDALQRAYSIVIALALTTSVKLLIESTGIVQTDTREQSPPFTTIMMFIAFISTLVVFYQGMNRHLDDTFVLGNQIDRSGVLLLVDIFVFLIEGSVLVVMASTINEPRSFLYAWSTLLGIDIIWGLFVYIFLKREAPAMWVANNAWFLACAWIMWLFICPQSAIWIAIIEILRSGVDYSLNWNFYFPRQHQSPTEGAT